MLYLKPDKIALVWALLRAIAKLQCWAGVDATSRACPSHPIPYLPVPFVASSISQWASEEWGTKMGERRKSKTGRTHGFNVCGKLQGPDESETRKGSHSWTTDYSPAKAIVY